MENQDPDPIREYLINEMLKNIIYIGLNKEKDNIRNELRKNITTSKRTQLQKKLEILIEDINVLKTNKNAKYNQVLYKRFYSNLSIIKKIIHNNKKNFEELINSYLILIDSNDVDKNPALLTQQLQYMRNKLRTYISVIPTDGDSENENIELYKQSLLEIEKKLDLLISQATKPSDNEIEEYTNEVERINEAIKSINNEDLKLLVSKLKINISEIKNKPSENQDTSGEESDNSDNSDNSNYIALTNKLHDNKATADELVQVRKKLLDVGEKAKQETINHAKRVAEMQASEREKEKEREKERVKERQKQAQPPQSSDEPPQPSEETPQTSDETQESGQIPEMERLPPREAVLGGTLTRKQEKMYKEVIRLFGGAEEKEFDFDKSFDKKENNHSSDESSDKSSDESSNNSSDESSDEKKENKEEQKREEYRKRERDKIEIKEAFKKDKKKIAYPVNNIKNNEELDTFKDSLLNDLHNIMSDTTKYSKNIYKWYTDDTQKSLTHKIKEIKELIENNLDKTKYKEVKPSDFVTEFEEKKAKSIRIQEIINDNIINKNDSIFNDNDGILVSLRGIENCFDEFKKILRDDKRKALDIFFNKNNSDRVKTTQEIDKLLELLNQKFKSNLTVLELGLVDIKNNLDKFNKDIDSNIAEFRTEQSKLETEHEAKKKSQRERENEREGGRDEDRRAYPWAFQNGRESDSKEVQQLKSQYAKDLTSLVAKFTTAIKDLDTNKFDNWLKILIKGMNTDIYDEYKYQIYGKLYNKLVETEKNISIKKGFTPELSVLTDEGNIITETSSKIENIFSNIWNKYHKSNKKDNKIKEEIEDDFYNAVKKNDLNPEKILELSSHDKIVYIVLIFVVRQISLLIVDILINNNIVKSLFSILGCYLGIYIGILVIMIIWVNMDNYKMRILFNFINFHINSLGVYNHIFTLILFTGIIYYYIYSTDASVRETKYDELSELEKIEIKYKLDVITLIIFVFTSLVDYLI